MWDSVGIDVLGSSGTRGRTDAVKAAGSGEPGVRNYSLPPASKQSYSVASVWDRAAGLTDAQQRSIEAVAASCAQRPLPLHLADAALPADPTPTAAAASAAQLSDSVASPRHSSMEPVDLGLSFVGTSFEDVTLQNSSEFYKWLSELEAARALETEGKFQRHAAVLDARLTSCDDLLATIDEILSLFDSLKEGQRAVSDRTAALHVTCERLVNEQEGLVAAAEAMRSKLAYFDELERVAAEFHASSLSIEGADVMGALKRLDESLAFVASHPHYADSATYTAKFKQLQGRALGAVRGKVQQALRRAGMAVQLSASGGSGGGSGVVSPKVPTVKDDGESGAETTLLYVRFRAATEASVKGLLHGVEARAGASPEYARLLRDCQGLHCETRLALMRGPVSAHLASLAGLPLPAILRAGCAFLLHIAQLEMQLFEHLFPASAAARAASNGALTPLLDPLCALLYDGMRPALVGLRDVDSLCELAYILRAEVLQDASLEDGTAASQGVPEAAALLAPVLRRMLGDIQERLTYRAQAFIRERVAGFVPSPADLDYPTLLLGVGEAGLEESSAGAGDGAGAGAATADREEGEISEAAPLKGDAAAEEQQQQQQYRGWYPPVQRSLLLLSKLYRTVPQKSFNGLAHEAVAAAAAAVQDAARAVTKAAGPLHGQLFSIRQLLILREQIAPFEADFSVVERSLDFSHVKDSLRRALSGQLPLFSFSSDNAMRQLVSRGGPRLSENQLDAKKDLERALKTACEAYIMAVTKLTVEPALTFLTKVTAVRVADGGEGPAKPLREQAFAAPDRVAAVAAAVREAVAGPLPEAAAALRAYLPAEQTRAALFKPIRSNVLEAHAQLASLLDNEYTKAEAAAAGLPAIEALEAALDEMA